MTRFALEQGQQQTEQVEQTIAQGNQARPNFDIMSLYGPLERTASPNDPNLPDCQIDGLGTNGRHFPCGREPGAPEMPPQPDGPRLGDIPIPTTPTITDVEPRVPGPKDHGAGTTQRPVFQPPFMPAAEGGQTSQSANGPAPIFRPTTGASSLEDLTNGGRPIPPPPFGQVWGEPQGFGPK